MRKNNFFLLLLMALIVMSCSKDETTMSIPQESNAIEFGTYVGRDAQTRATITNIGALQATDVGFGVFAHYTKTTAYGTPETTPNFMYNQQVKYASSKWGYTPIKYWPNNTGDLVSFFAYGPHSSIANSNISDFAPTSTNTGDPTLKFTVVENVKNQTDLVWGVNESTGFPFLDQTKQTVTGDIKFTFKHALARIGFNVEAMVDLVNDEGTGTPDDGTTGNGTIDENTKIVVTKVELIGNFYASGALNLNNTTANVPSWTGAPGAPIERTFTLNAGADATASNFNGPTSVGLVTGGETFGKNVTNAKATLNATDSYIMVIPQISVPVKIRVTYDVITKDDKLNTQQSKVTNVITSDRFDFTFAAGKAYSFNLHLGMTSVKFDADVSPWEAVGTGTVVNVPINTTAP